MSLAAASGTCATLLALGGHWAIALAFALAAAILAKAGAARLGRARKREFGKAIEEEYVQRALQELADRKIRAQANVRVRGVGDIDMVARIGRHLVTIEVKSFRRWNQSPISTGDRENRAILQVRRQMQAIGAKTGFVWLPQGQPNTLQKSLSLGAGTHDIDVIFGDERALARAIEKLG